MKKLIISFSFFCLVGFASINTVLAQADQIDSLLVQLNEIETDSSRIDTWNKIAYSYWNIDPSLTIVYADSALELSQRFGNEILEGQSLRMKGIGYWARGQYEIALDLYLKAIPIFEKYQAEKDLANVYNNIGIIYYNEREYDLARDYYQLAYDIRINLDDAFGLASSYNNLGLVNYELGEYQKAIENHQKSLEFAREIDFLPGIAQNLSNIGRNYTKLERFSEAFQFAKEALSIRKQTGDTKGVAATLNNLGEIFLLQKNYQKATSFLDDAVQISQEANALDVLEQALNNLAQVKENQRQFEEAILLYKRAQAVSDSLITIEKARKIAEMQYQNELVKKEAENLFLREQESLQNEVIRQQSLALGLLILGSVLLLLTAWSFYRSRRKERLAKEAIAEQAAKIESQRDKITTQNKTLEELNQRKDYILSVIGHDLRGPIGTVQQMLEEIQNDADYLDIEDKEMLLKASHNASGMTLDLLENLLYWAQSQQKEIRVNKDSLTVSKVVDSVLAMYRLMAEGKSISVSFSCDSEFSLYADSHLFKMTLRNLVANAVKFTPIGGKITVSTNQDDESVYITVTDSGKGLSPNQIETINQGNRVSSTVGTRQEQGMGLGLSLCQNCMKLNGGSLVAGNSLNGGAEFVMIFPKLS